jgi:flavin reductase (DIM6/NTAB) family NADH-FMN oxidoreductase RutF
VVGSSRTEGPRLRCQSATQNCLPYSKEPTTGRDVAKFGTFALTPVLAKRVAAPLIAECFANLDCEVADSRLVNKYNLFVLEVLKAWTDPRQKNPKTIHYHGHGKFVVDGGYSQA